MKPPKGKHMCKTTEYFKIDRVQKSVRIGDQDAHAHIFFTLGA